MVWLSTFCLLTEVSSIIKKKPNQAKRGVSITYKLSADLALKWLMGLRKPPLSFLFLLFLSHNLINVALIKSSFCSMEWHYTRWKFSAVSVSHFSVGDKALKKNQPRLPGISVMQRGWEGCQPWILTSSLASCVILVKSLYWQELRSSSVTWRRWPRWPHRGVRTK